ncbi:carboxypeptidase-like regulatory domain-containing protein [Aggregatimonas sangjinii]|uniref:Carboxypeptidase-like regulatory domain-containing protein n=1 Tax=Aggregatimonas sangjinii TaxID=2583587 RepID=A0A5B7SUW5_9FLAO|nr:carboxypeptidase-like regulatory domain-containing protein [Aggregatimonas sangjinii]QCX00711.1 carboxypeptidase-like regulatory domain-containing protein [Aggregatimonas sangjinii]
MKTKQIYHRLKSVYAAGLFAILLLGGTQVALGFQEQQQETTLKQYKGEVLDADTKRPLVFATLSLEGTNVSTVSNTEGEFALKIPKEITEGSVKVSFLGYKSKSIPLAQFSAEDNQIFMEVSVLKLTEVNLSIPKDARALVKETLKRKGENYFDDPTLMTAFYRETIKKRRKNVSLSEAVVNIYKTPYDSDRRDAMQLYKSRKSTDYSRMDTVALKLQGGPFNALLVDIMKYPEYIFTDATIEDYDFKFERSTREDGKLLYVVEFDQKENIIEPMYKGKLYIDADKKVLQSAIYELNITNKEIASKMFVRRKPRNANVYPTEVAYRIDYREKNGKWYYGYSNVLLEFKINWDKRLFNSVYSMTCEMAVTDWEKNLSGKLPKSKERMKSSIILSDEAVGFADPNFWGEYNIIEPEKSIESAIRKIQRQLRRAREDGGTSTP